MIHKVAIVGPESTGKSTLSAQLAAHYHTCWVPEYARTYLEALGRPYKEEDLLAIAQGQLAEEEVWAAKAKHLLFCDTELTVVKVWSEHKYKRCDPWIIAQHHQRKYDLYLLTYIDIPWQEDPQREHPHLRQHFYAIYEREIQATGTPWVAIRGDSEQRFATAKQAIDRLIQMLKSEGEGC